MRRVALIGIVAVVMICMGELLHNLRRLAQHPSESDPKNAHYVHWKQGLYPLDPDIALGTMIGDPERDSIVIGKSKEELVKRFGYVTPIDQASEYDKAAYRSLELDNPDDQIIVLRNSTWLVEMSNGRASKLILVKGF